jgi:hypothetical protein
MTSPWSVRRRPSYGIVLPGGAVVSWCVRCGGGVQAVGMDVDCLPPGPSGRAA